MKHYQTLLLLCATAALPPTVSATSTIEELLQTYRREDTEVFDAESGRQFWNREFASSKDGQSRSCSTCHTADPRKTGKHARTGKTIEPIAPSVNPARLSEIREIEKWLGRNCKWTLGRECTAREKGDVLNFLKDQ